MSFTVDGIVFDRLHKGVAMTTDKTKVLYTLSQLVDATIEVTAESVDAKDKDGTLIKRTYKGKSGTFSANSALLDANILGESAGSGKISATEDTPITTPMIKDVPVGSATTVTIDGLIDDTVKIVGESASGTQVTSYTQSAAAGTKAFSVSEGVITLPTATDVAKFVIVCDRETKIGSMVENRADKFPRTVTLILKAYSYDVCTPGVLRSTYIEIPSFQVSPEVNFTLATDSQLPFNGDMQVSYCNPEGKILYRIYFPGDDNEEE